MEEVLWKFLGEYLSLDILPPNWFENLEEAKCLCTTVCGYLRLMDNEWYLGDTQIEISRIFRLKWESNIYEHN